jgi:beta-lactamase regulating signal transducer with metallopeptidase domain
LLQSAEIDNALAAIAIAWLVIVLMLLLRLGGGFLISRSLVAKARNVEDQDTTQAAAEIAEAAGVTFPVPILESSEVDAPVVLGWRKPTLILPRAALLRLTGTQVRALLTHEFAHIRRRDYLANLLQSLAELPFFFTPGVAWMSRWIRETREFCCDDEAAARLGDRVHYVEALTTLAALGTINRTRAAVGSSGPRLIVRVRRLLQEDSVPKLRSLRLIALAAALVLVVIAGLGVSAAAAARFPRAGQSITQGKVPFGWVPDQQGSGVHLKQLQAEPGAPALTATLQNVSTEPIVAVRFVAAIERRGSTGLMRVQLVRSEEIPLALPPGQSAEVAPAVVTQQQLDSLASNPDVKMLQYFVGLDKVTFANGHVWSITPNPNATQGFDALGIPAPFYPRSLIERDVKKQPAPYAACIDDANHTTSHGGVIPILNEPGHFMRCDSGRWVEGLGQSGK